MSVLLAVIIAVILMIGVGITVFILARKKSARIYKYIPAVLSAVGLVFFTIKLNFIPYKNHAFEGIYDVIAIIFLGISLIVSVVISVLLEIVSKRRESFK